MQENQLHQVKNEAIVEALNVLINSVPQVQRDIFMHAAGIHGDQVDKETGVVLVIPQMFYRVIKQAQPEVQAPATPTVNEPVAVPPKEAVAVQ